MDLHIEQGQGQDMSEGEPCVFGPGAGLSTSVDTSEVNLPRVWVGGMPLTLLRPVSAAPPFSVFGLPSPKSAAPPVLVRVLQRLLPMTARTAERSSPSVGNLTARLPRRPGAARLLTNEPTLGIGP